MTRWRCCVNLGTEPREPAPHRFWRLMSTEARVEDEEAEVEAVEPLPLDKLAPEVLNIIAEALAADEDLSRAILPASPALAK